ncbi:MAG: tRNA lysidine(34) synthetase TilS [Syntrophaceae bacterium]|nr:tRNA lysidine(34) synthetase TilS [Syntrophaceae bacterium]
MLFRQFKRTIDHYQLLEKGERLIVGVSGGVDSMVLLHLLNAYREAFQLTLIVAHVNHGLRPEESEKEAELVQTECELHGFPFEYGQFNVREFQKTAGLSTQDAARRIRFQFFQDLLKKHKATKIALGHNADDQIETILLRLMRGSGVEGLKGMLPIREGKVIRPLLESWREDIESFAAEKEIHFCLDSSNLKEDYLRNRIRLSLIPLIEKEYQPNFKKVLLSTSAILRIENDYLERSAEEAYQRIVQETGDTLSFKFSEYQSLHPIMQWRIVRKMIETFFTQATVMRESNWSDVRRIYRELQNPRASFILECPPGLWVEKRYDRVKLGRVGFRPYPPFEVELVSPGRTVIEEIGKEIVIEEVNRVQFNQTKEFVTTAFMDYEKLQFPMRVRNFRPGDRFCPLGVKGTQKLKEFFIDHKVPKFERPKIPLLISGEMIAWIMGYRIDNRVKVTEKTKRVLKVEMI